MPVHQLHPATSANLDIPNSTDCPHSYRTGVLTGSKYTSDGVFLLDLVVGSEGLPSPDYATSSRG
jgi:hypothetical protein